MTGQGACCAQYSDVEGEAPMLRLLHPAAGTPLPSEALLLLLLLHLWEPTMRQSAWRFPASLRMHSRATGPSPDLATAAGDTGRVSQCSVTPWGQ